MSGTNSILSINSAEQSQLLYDFVPSAVGQDTCTPFLRTIRDGATTDTDLDGLPYTVVGGVRTSCPVAQAEPSCNCTDELQALQTSVDSIAAQSGCNCTDELQALQISVDSIAALFGQKYTTPNYWYCTAAHTVLSYYKSLTVTFINEGTINGKYAPAGYSFSHPREIDVTYLSDVELDGTGFAVWEDR